MSESLVRYVRQVPPRDLIECLSKYGRRYVLLRIKNVLPNDTHMGAGQHEYSDTEDYTEKFFAQHLLWRRAYEQIGESMLREFNPCSAIDFGCGVAHIITYLKRNGVKVMGLEKSQAAFHYMNRQIARDVARLDITKPLPSLGSFDIAISTEVAEHLRPQSSETFVQNLTDHSARWVYFTAAPPGQPGVHHVNCQPREFWISKFARAGFSFRTESTERIRKALATREVTTWIPWIQNNLMIFEKGELPSRD